MSDPTYFARIVDDVVEGIYVADAEWVSQQDGVWIQSTDDNRASQGASVVDGVFIHQKLAIDPITDTVILAPNKKVK